MSLRHLKVFIAVCEYGTMRKAAEVLHIAQPSISIMISEIEKHYNIVLFERINQRLVITESGKMLLKKAKAVLSAFYDFEETAKNNAESPTVNIGSSLTIGKKIIPDLINSLKENFPSICPNVKICKASLIEEFILDGEMDFALIEGEPLSEDIDKSVIEKDRLIVISGKDYNIKNKIQLVDLVKYPFLIRESGSASRNYLENVMNDNKLKYSAIIISQSNEALLEAAKENIGISVLPYSLVKEELMKNSIKEIKVDNVSFERNYYIIKNKNKKLSANSLKVYNFLKNKYFT